MFASALFWCAIRLWARVRANAKPVKGVEAKQGIGLKPGLVARVRYLKGEEKLRHATLQEVGERDG